MKVILVTALVCVVRFVWENRGILIFRQLNEVEELVRTCKINKKQ